MCKLKAFFGEELWDVVVDLAAFFHPRCYNCMPFDDGEPVWLSTPTDAEDALNEICVGVAECHDLDFGEFDGSYEALSNAIDEGDLVCDGCGTTWALPMQVASDWVPDGEDTANATHLLSKRYWPYLTHYTKDAASLDAILRGGAISGTVKFIPSGDRVVCLTECSPIEIHELMKSRDEESGDVGERYKWNRSNYGVAIHRTAACSHGALPAIYGSKELLQALPAHEAHRFVRFDRSGKGYADWTFEREFRIKGDVDMHQLDPHEMFIIVANKADRFAMLARLDVPPWPVMSFDYAFPAEGYPSPRATRRQAAKQVCKEQ